MKKLLIAILSIVAVMLLFGCSEGRETMLEYEVIQNYESQDGLIPTKIFVSEGERVLMLSTHVGSQAASKIALENDQSEAGMRIIYETETGWVISERSVSISSKFIAWFESDDVSETSSHYKLRVYDRASAEIKTVFENTVDMQKDETQSTHSGIYGEKIYYLQNDYTKAQCLIRAYDMNSGEAADVASVPFAAGREGIWRHSVTFLNMTGSKLVFNNISEICVYDVAAGLEVTSAVLPEDPWIVYAADYDAESDCYCVYYSEPEGADQVAVFGEDQPLWKFLTPSETAMLYEDRLVFREGKALYTLQLNVTGLVSEHYDSFVFDTEKRTLGEADRCYFFDMNGDELRGLVFSDDASSVMYVRYTG